jgi:TonB family protein
MSFFVTGTFAAQNDQDLSSAAENAGPVFIHGEPVYRIGRDVVGPRVIFSPDPEYSEEARRAQLQGTCLLWLVVGSDGKTRDVRIVHSLGLGLDEKSVETIRMWRFEPAMKDGQAVAVRINVETSFRLYSEPGLPAALDSAPSKLAHKHAADYPLLLKPRFATGKSSVDGYVVTAEATVAEGAEPGKVIAISCGPKGKCFMLKAANYRARWIGSTEMELLGIREDTQKLQKARFSVQPL